MSAPSGVKTIKLELVSPERVVASEEAAMVVLPGVEGDMGILAEHAPLVSSLRPGVVAIHSPASGTSAGEVKRIFVTAGFADVSPTLCSILAEQAINVADIDRAKVEQELKSLNDKLATAEDDVRKASLKRDIAVAEAKLAVAA